MFLLLALAPLLLPAGPPQDPDPVPAEAEEPAPRVAMSERDDELARIGEELVRLTFELAPWDTRLRGWRGSRFGIEKFAYAQRPEWVEAMNALAKRLAEIDSDELSPEQAAERESLIATVDGRKALYETRAPERWNAELHVERVERVLVANTFELPPEQQVLEMLRVLEALPAYWKQAQASLLSPEKSWNQRAIARLIQLETYIRSRRSDFDEFGEGATAKLALKTLAAGLDATRSFRTWLQGSPAGVGGSPTRLGAERWLRLIRDVTGTTWSIEEIKWNVLRDLARAEREHGARWRTRPAGELDLELVAEMDRILGAACTRAMDVARRAGVLDTYETSNLVSFGASEIPARFGRPVIVLPEEDRMRALVDPSTLAGADSGTTFALALRHGFPGGALLRHHAAASPDPLARFLWNRSVVEGWGLYTLDWLTRIDWIENEVAGNEAFRSEAARLRVLEGARLLAVLEQHAEGYSEEETTEGFQRRTGLGLGPARRETRQAIGDPLWGIGYLGWVELRAREEYLREDDGLQGALARSLAEGLASPHLRPLDRP